MLEKGRHSAVLNITAARCEVAQHAWRSCVKWYTDKNRPASHSVRTGSGYHSTGNYFKIQPYLWRLCFVAPLSPCRTRGGNLLQLQQLVDSFPDANPQRAVVPQMVQHDKRNPPWVDMLLSKPPLSWGSPLFICFFFCLQVYSMFC